MKLFENETDSIYQTKETDFIYMLESGGQKYCSLVLPKIVHSNDEKLMKVIFQDLNREKIENIGNKTFLWNVIDNYETLSDSRVYERKIIASINLLSTLFSFRNRETFGTKYGMTLNKVLISGHFSGLYFEALDLMDSELKGNQFRGRNLMNQLDKSGNPLARKRKEVIHELGYIDFDD